MGHMKNLDIVLRNGGQEAVDAVNRMAADIEAMMPRWIPVGERLPEPDVDVLIHFAISGREIGCIEGLSGRWLCAREVCSDEATHWMPLPEPPA